MDNKENKLALLELNNNNKLVIDENQKIKKKIDKFQKNMLVKDTDMIKQIRYYKYMNFNTNKNYKLLAKNKQVTIKDVYLVVKQDKKNKILKYEIYFRNPNNLIALVQNKNNKSNLENKVKYLNTSMNKYLEKSNIDKMLLLNKDNLKMIKKINEKNKNINKNDINNEKETKKESKVNKIHKIEKDLGLDMNDIRSCTKVNMKGDINLFRDKVPEAKEYDIVQLVYLNKEKEFRFIGKKYGEPYKYLNSIEPSKETIKKSINVKDNGEKIEENNINGLMKLNSDRNYDFAVNITKYGEIELNILRKDQVTNRYMATQIETTTQKPNSRQVKEMMDKDRNCDISEEIAKYDDRIYEGDENINLYEISDDKRKDRVLDENQKINTEEKDKKEKIIEEELKKEEQKEEKEENWGPWESMKPKMYE